VPERTDQVQKRHSNPEAIPNTTQTVESVKSSLKFLRNWDSVLVRNNPKPRYLKHGVSKKKRPAKMRINLFSFMLKL
jgi:hypothetical protein